MPARRKTMPSRLPFFALLLSLLALAACGGDDKPEPASSTAAASSDASALLRETFANLDGLTSATLDLKLDIEPRGGAEGKVTASFSGPYESQGAGKLPKFAFGVEAEAGGQRFDAGATYTGEQAFVTFQGTPYAVADAVLEPFVAGYEQAAKGQPADKTALAGLGIDFAKWLPSPVTAGGARVGDVDTLKVSGQADVKQVLADLDRITEKAASLPGGQSVPQKLTAEQKRAVEAAVQNLTVTVYTGAGDHILRRLTLGADIRDAASKTDAGLVLDLTLTKVGEPQQIEEPADPKPFSELETLLGPLTSGLVGVGGGSSKVDEYADCVEAAAGDTAKAGKCAELLTG